MNGKDLFIYTKRSMRPLFKEADILQVVPYSDPEIRIGDIIIFHSPEDATFIIHRVISVPNEVIRTKGDNNNEPEPLIISHKHVISKVGKKV